MNSLANQRVTVMGLGRFEGGVGVTRWLAAQGARVTVTDLAPAEKLGPSLHQLDGLDVRLVLGRHDERDFREADLVAVNPAVPENSPFLKVARDAGVPLTTEINLFVERCPAACVGVTGSVGKSTITAMIGHLLARAQPRRVWVGGNIGRSLLDALPELGRDDLVVLELSSFQLAWTPLVRWSPRVAVITNVTPNHLDRHGTFAAYLAAKLNLIRFQDPACDAIIIEDHPELTRNFDLLHGDLAGVWRYGVCDGVASARLQSSSAIDCDDQRASWPQLQLGVPGRHNRANAAAALTVAHVLGVPAEAAVAALASFEALPHRLQRVAQRAGVTYYNDSKSSTPQAAITAMHAIDQPLLVILGGYDKGIDLTPAAQVAAQRAKFIACIGKTGPRLLDAVRTAGGAVELCETLDRAVAACQQRAQPGDAILLSPACASWDQFEDYRARGEAFGRLALTP